MKKVLKVNWSVLLPKNQIFIIKKRKDMENAVMLTASLVKKLSPTSLCVKEGDFDTVILNTVDRIKLQTYLLNGKLLPIEEKEFMKLLEVPSEEKTKFDKLLDFYREVHAHCSSFFDGGFTDSVSLASDLVDYAGKVEVFYPSLLKAVEDVLNDKIAEKAGEKKINAILDDIIVSLERYIERCQLVMDSVDIFYEQTLKDLKELQGADGKSGLLKEYSTEYNLDSETLESLRQEYENFSKDLSKASADYEYNVIVAATTPTYAWVFPFGTIPAIVVAGVYGDRAVKSKKKLDKAIANLAITSKRINLFIALQAASTQLQELAGNMRGAMEPVQRLKGYWGAMLNDLLNLKKSGENVEKMAWIIKDLGLEEHMNKWKALAVRADEYRLSAFIADVVKTSDKEQSKVA